MENEMNRRNFLKHIALAGGGLILIPPYFQSCNSCKGEGENALVDALLEGAEAPFGIWRQMIEALEKSPDHLIGRRKALIASKDPKAMTEFVRDNIQLAPQLYYFLRYSERGILYGAEGALRSGIGTAREKAEILKDMFVAAGFEARVVLEYIDFTEEEVKNIVFRTYRPEFNADISDKQIKSWQKSMGTDSSEATFKEISDAEEQSKSFTNKILNELKDFDFEKLGNNFKAPQNEVPSVAYMQDGEEKYAHVFDPYIPFGSLHPKNSRDGVKDAYGIQALDNPITIRLTHRTALESHVEKELLSGTWDLEKLLGSTLSLQFLNNMDFKRQATSTISQINSFTPCFSFQKFGTEKEYMEENSVLGEPINLNGKEVLKKQDNDLEPNLNEISLPGNTDRVTRIKINAIPMAFPEMRIEMFATDEQGNIVEGLTAANFELNDNQKAVDGRLEKNVVSPKVMMLYDTSISMPQEYREVKQIADFRSGLETVIREIYPQADIKSQKTGSDIYTSLLRAKQSDFDLIMYATDGDNDDKFDPKYLEIYNSGQPMLILEVRPKSHTYDELKTNISNLISIPATDQEAVKQEISSILSGLSFPPYVMTYHSFAETEEHVLKVKLNDKDIGDEAIFKFPEQSDLFLGDRMVGLYLTIQGKGLKVRRTLAGWDNEVSNYNHSRAYIDEVHEMMLGGAVMAFEGEAPSLSIRLTEYLTSLLSHEKWFNAHREGDIENAIKYLEEGTLDYPPLLLTMMQPLDNAFTKETATIPMGFRSSILKFKPGYYSPESKVSFDYLPTSDYFTVSKSGDGKTNFTETLKKTMQFAVLESEMFQDSTITQLKGKPLMQPVKARKEKEFNERMTREVSSIFTRRIFREGDIVFFDHSLASTAYFKINKNTGALFANLPDGTGGGGDSIERQLKELQGVVERYEQVLSGLQLSMIVGGVGTFPIGIVAAYSLTLVRLYAYASEAIIIMDASNLDAQVASALKTLAGSVYKSIAYLTLGRVGKGMSGIEKLIGLMGK